MQKKDLQSHMIKLHGAPKPHAVSASQGWGSGGSGTAQPCPHLDVLPLPVSSTYSAPLVPSASCLGRSYSCTRLLSIVEKSSLCVRNAGTGPRAATDCRCTSRPSTGMKEEWSAPSVQCGPATTGSGHHLLPESRTCSPSRVEVRDRQFARLSGRTQAGAGLCLPSRS